VLRHATLTASGEEAMPCLGPVVPIPGLRFVSSFGW